MDSSSRKQFCHAFSLAQQDCQQGVTAQRSAADDGMWDVWSDFCTQMGFNALLHQYEDPIPILQVFARLLRTGTLAPSKKPIRKRTVESYLRAIGQTHTALGAPDPRQTWSGKTDFRLQQQLAHYQKEDPPPKQSETSTPPNHQTNHDCSTSLAHSFAHGHC